MKTADYLDFRGTSVGWALCRGN